MQFRGTTLAVDSFEEGAKAPGAKEFVWALDDVHSLTGQFVRTQYLWSRTKEMHFASNPTEQGHRSSRNAFRTHSPTSTSVLAH